MPNETMVDIVDENDNVIGQISEYDSTYEHKKITRAISIFIYNSKGEILLVKRSRNKWRHPLHYCASVGGFVDSGEDYTTAALRELYEELGVKKKAKDLQFILKRIVKTDKNEMVSLFKLTYDGEFSINYDEVDSIRWTDPKVVLKLVKKGEKFTDYFLQLFKAAGL